MSANLTSDSPQRSRIHPLVAGAAVAVILASATGIAAMTGILPTSRAMNASAPQAVAATTQTASATPAATQPITTPHVAQDDAPVRPRVHPAYRAPSSAAPRYANNQGYQPQQVAADPYAGEVVAINAIQAPEPTTGLGAVGGAVAGGLLGNQIGGGRGRILTTIAGVVGGGVAGNSIEHAVRKQTSYQVQVRMQDGSYRNFTYPTQPGVQIGEHVRVSGDGLTAG